MSFTETVVDLSASFEPNPVTKDLTVLKDEAAIKQHIELLLFCDEFSTIGRPFVCAGIKKIINEESSDSKIAEIKSRIKETLRFEPRVSVENVSVVFEPDTKYVKITITMTFVRTGKELIYETRLRRVL